LYVFGIQEIVTLNASSVIQADEKNMRIWANILLDSINRKRHPNNKVIILSHIFIKISRLFLLEKYN
jgi:hypothetical protein